MTASSCEATTQTGSRCVRIPFASTRAYLELAQRVEMPISTVLCKQHISREDLEVYYRAAQAWADDELPVPLEPPACWTWLAPASSADGDPWAAVVAWQSGRCALCGVEGQPMVRDHDHWSGKCRGQLCRACNTHEGSCWRSSCRCARYRERPPVAIVGVEVDYPTIWWMPAISRVDDPEADAARVAAIRRREPTL